MANPPLPEARRPSPSPEAQEIQAIDTLRVLIRSHTPEPGAVEIERMLDTALDTFARAVAREATSGSCETCAHWTETTRRREKQRKGDCIAVKCFTDMVINGGGGCGECDPYSMNETTLLTAATFRCQHYTARAAQQETPSSASHGKTKT